jgi:hypothetical protein
MIAAKIVKVRYQEKGDHTVDFSRFGHAVAAKSPESWEGTLEAVLANNHDHAAKRLSVFLRKHLLACRAKCDLSAFTFDFGYADVAADGRFWIHFGTISGGNSISSDLPAHLDIIGCQTPPTKEQPQPKTSSRKSEPV